jgi:hypothetical protein
MRILEAAEKDEQLDDPANKTFVIVQLNILFVG